MTITLGTLTAALKAGATWKDAYPAWQGYADECELLLKFAQRHKVLARYWPRLSTRAQQRDEAINELRVAYMLDSLGFPVVDWEPKDAGNHELEYSIRLGKVPDGLVEVKSPGWEGELTLPQRLAGRAKMPKYLPGVSGGAAGPTLVIRRSVEKALPKFTDRAPTVLFIADDCFVNLGEWGSGPGQMALLQRSIAYGDGLFHQPAYAVIGAVVLFWTRTVLGSVQYKISVMENPNALQTAKLPERLLAALKR